jgi:peptidoglycan hydrolase-like protein with peptidoglycan-binding domain
VTTARLKEAVANGAVNLDALSMFAVAELQTLLHKAGFKQLKSDGLMGPKTAEAFANFKKTVWLSNPTQISTSSLQTLVEEASDRAKGITPFDKPASKRLHQISKMLPSGGAVYVESAVVLGGHFSWGEFTKNGVRWPRSVEVENRIKAIALQLETVREKLGNRQITITSGYRPNNDPVLGDVNKSVGGVRYSRHIVGDAVDIQVVGMSVSEVFRKLKPWWPGGIAPSYRGGFVHLDLGPKRTWLYS